MAASRTVSLRQGHSALRACHNQQLSRVGRRLLCCDQPFSPLELRAVTGDVPMTKSERSPRVLFSFSTSCAIPNLRVFEFFTLAVVTKQL